MDGGSSTMSMEKLVEMWNHTMTFPSLNISDLSPTVKTSAFTSALMEILQKLGIDREAIVTPPEGDRDEHIEYYWDLIPFINLTRILNHILSGFQNDFKTKMMDLLNPSPRYAHWVLLLLMNLVNFYGSRRESIEPRERDLFQQREKIAMLEQECAELVGKLEEQALAKQSRAIRLKKLEEDKGRVSAEYQTCRAEYEEQARELDSVLEKNRSLQSQLDKRKLQREALQQQLDTLNSLKVSDAEDIKAQLEQTIRLEKEVTQKIESMKETRAQKEATVKNLEAVKSTLVQCITHAHDITSITEMLKEVEQSTCREKAEMEAAVAKQEAGIAECEGSAAEVRQQLEETAQQRQEEAHANKKELNKANRMLKESEENLSLRSERAERAQTRLPELQRALEKHAADKLNHERRLLDIADNFDAQLKSHEELLLQESKKVARHIEEKLSRIGRF